MARGSTDLRPVGVGLAAEATGPLVAERVAVFDAVAAGALLERAMDPFVGTFWEHDSGKWR